MAEEKKEIPEKFKKIVEEIEKMSVIDLAQLVKILEEKFGVSSAPALMPVSLPQEKKEEAGEEKKFFSVLLTSAGEKKIEVIRLVKDLVNKGLKEVKDLVDAVAQGPQLIKENVKKEEAEEIKKKLEGVGAKVELK
ncbi:MAG: 50S ribosomal protein L7/L12 [Minisyncoccales bacterium]